MLKSISLTNVRAFSRKEWEFQLGGLTALCGANSAGKSTVIKSLLFLKTNLRSDPTPDIQNMGRVQFASENFDLGDFRSFVSGNNLRKTISIGIVSEGETQFQVKHLNALLPRKFDEVKGEDRVTVPYSLHSKFIYRYIAARGPSTRRRAVREDDPGFSVLDSATFSLFVKKKCVGRLIVELTPSARTNFPREMSGNIDVPYIFKLTKAFFESTGGARHIVPERTSRDGKFVEFTPTLSGSLPTGAFGYTVAKSNTKKSVDRKDDKGDQQRILIPVPPYFRPAINALKKDFDGIEYVAPIRAQAKRFYVLNQDYDIGGDAAGESIPYLLRDNLNLRAKLPVPASPLDTSSMTLQAALNSWLKYFTTDQVLTEASPQLASKNELTIDFHRGLIAEIRLRNRNGQPIPLADNGFGYSQVLPILIKGLLLKKNGTLVIEQPELHLHPALQIKLALFFAALVASDRRVILETHSEHIINALRVIAVEDVKHYLAPKFKIFFIDWLSGRPVISDLTVTDNGDIPELPHGFFGEALSLTGRLLRAQKARRERQQSSNR